MSLSASEVALLAECENLFASEMAKQFPDFPIYRDISWTTIESWQKVMALIGEGNYQVLACSTRPSQNNEGKTSIRGQIMMNEQGMENLKTYSQINKPTSTK